MGRTLQVTYDGLLGDSLMISPALRSWKKANPDGTIRFLAGNDRGTYNLFLHNPYIDELILHPQGAPQPDPGEWLRLDAGTAFNWGAIHNNTLAWGYGRQIPLQGWPMTEKEDHPQLVSWIYPPGCVDIDSLLYDYVITPEEYEAAREHIDDLAEGQPVVCVARHSASCSSNDQRVMRPNKCVSNRLWCQAADWLLKQGYMPVALGSQSELTDSRYSQWPGTKAYGLPIREVAAMLSLSAGVLAVDTGIRHLAAAAGANLYCLSGAIPLSLIRCEAINESQVIHEEHVPLGLVSTRTLIEGAKRVIARPQLSTG